MTRCLALINVWFLSLCLSAQTMVGCRQMTTGVMARYNTLIDFRGNGVSGICVLKLRDDGMLVGTLVNEFGIKAMDFTYSPTSGRVKLLNVIKFMDKWYIRKVVQQDLACMLSSKESTESKRRAVTVQPDGSLELANKKYKINYHLIPIAEY